MNSVDVAIVGGGMVGASLALALEGLGLTSALIEAVAPGAEAQPSFDERTTALSNGSRRILETLGMWAALAPAATPIRKIHVSDRGHFGFARIDAAEQGLAALGYVVPNRLLGRALFARLAPRADLEILCPAQVEAVDARPEAVELSIRGADGTLRPLAARLVVAADGAASAVRSAFGVVATVRSYEQTALIATVTPRKFHDHVAFERFTESGPLALLPSTQGHCVLVLTVATTDAEALLRASDETFLAEVQRRFGYRLGRFLKVGRRSAYPLALSRAQRTSALRCAIVGNAAQALHPVAGMGFNLGLRDAACLAELLAAQRAEAEAGARAPEARSGWSPGVGSAIAAAPDPGSALLLAQYDEWRAADRRLVIGFTDGLVRLFGQTLPPVYVLRNLGLLAFDVLPPAKRALAALSTGAAGRVPKLARGVPLIARPDARSRAY